MTRHNTITCSRRVPAVRRWFVTAPFAVWVDLENGRERVPHPVHHAKEMGTQRTACGRNTTTWFKWWERVFDPDVDGACADCAEVLRAVGEWTGDSGSPRRRPRP